MSYALNFASFAFSVIGISLVCHLVGDFGHQQKIDVLIVAPVILGISFLGMFSIIYKTFEVN